MKRAPSSSIATLMPPSASSFATGAPPAPLPITQASTLIRRSPAIRDPRSTRSSRGTNIPRPSV